MSVIQTKNLTGDAADHYCVVGGPAEPFISLGLVEAGASLLGGAGSGGDGGGEREKIEREVR